MRRQRKYFVAIAVIVMTTAFSFVLKDTAFFGNALMPIQSAAAKGEDIVVDIINIFKNGTQLAEENKKLREELGEARAAMAEAAALEDENERLRDQLKISARDDSLELLAATVTGGVSGYQIDKGMDEGAEQYMAVVTPEGIWGYISEIGGNWSTITPICSGSFTCGGRNCNTRETGVLAGDGRSLYLKYLLPTSVTREGDLIITDGGGKFPKGMVVGVVDSVYEEENGLSRTARITPTVDITKTNRVFVVLDQNESIM